MYTNRFETRYAGIALTVLLSTALSLPAHAAEIWKVNLAKSTFSSGSNTLVLERASGKASTQGIDAKGKPDREHVPRHIQWEDLPGGGRRHLRHIFRHGRQDGRLHRLERHETRADRRQGAIRGLLRVSPVKRGLPDRRMTLTFTAKGVDPSRQMSTILVLNK